MNAASFADDGFPVGACPACGKRVLAYHDLETHRCLHCDGPLESVEAAPYEALEAMGYGLVEAERAGKCAESGTCSLTGARVTGPGSGGCGGGTCGR